MTTLTLSSFTKAMRGNIAPPVSAAMPFPAALHVEVAPMPAKVYATTFAATHAAPVPQVETKTQHLEKSDTITYTEPTKKDDDMATKEELLAKAKQAREAAEAAEQELEAFRATERTDVLARIRADMSEYGITSDELLGRSAIERRSGKGVKRGAAAIKYADKASGSQWSGRGQKPLWLVAAIASGKKIEDFAV